MRAERGHGDGFHTVRELTMDAAAGDADEGPEAGAHVLRPEAVAVDASAVGRQLEEAPHDPLVPLLLLPRRGHHRLAPCGAASDGELQPAGGLPRRPLLPPPGIDRARGPGLQSRSGLRAIPASEERTPRNRKERDYSSGMRAVFFLLQRRKQQAGSSGSEAGEWRPACPQARRWVGLC